MKRICFLLALVMAVTLSVPKAGLALDYVSNAKKWEYSLSLGYATHTAKDVTDGVAAGFRAQKRIAYPVLIGLGVDASYYQKIFLGSISVPVTYRVGLGRLKLDAILKPGAAYARNFDNNKSKIVGMVTPGIEVKKFIDKGTSIGVGLFYSAYTYSDLNDIRLIVTYGF